MTIIIILIMPGSINLFSLVIISSLSLVYYSKTKYRVTYNWYWVSSWNL